MFHKISPLMTYLTINVLDMYSLWSRVEGHVVKNRSRAFLTFRTHYKDDFRIYQHQEQPQVHGMKQFHNHHQNNRFTVRSVLFTYLNSRTTFWKYVWMSVVWTDGEDILIRFRPNILWWDSTVLWKTLWFVRPQFFLFTLITLIIHEVAVYSLVRMQVKAESCCLALAGHLDIN